MLAFDAKRVFDAIPEPQRWEWVKREATLDQICPAVRHETSANRNEVLRMLNNWRIQVMS